MGLKQKSAVDSLRGWLPGAPMWAIDAKGAGFASATYSLYANIGLAHRNGGSTMNKPPNQQVTSEVDQGQIRQLASRLTLETLHDGRLWVFTFGRRTRDSQVSSRTVIDAWFNAMKKQMDLLPVGASWYRLSDFSQTDMNPSPFFVARIREISRYRPDLHGHSAYVIPQNLFTAMMLNIAQRIRPKHIRIKLFFRRDEALQWLEDQLKSVPQNGEVTAKTA